MSRPHLFTDDGTLREFSLSYFSVCSIIRQISINLSIYSSFLKLTLYSHQETCQFRVPSFVNLLATKGDEAFDSHFAVPETMIEQSKNKAERVCLEATQKTVRAFFEAIETHILWTNRQLECSSCLQVVSASSDAVHLALYPSLLTMSRDASMKSRSASIALAKAAEELKEHIIRLEHCAEASESMAEELRTLGLEENALLRQRWSEGERKLAQFLALCCGQLPAANDNDDSHSSTHVPKAGADVPASSVEMDVKEPQVREQQAKEVIIQAWLDWRNRLASVIETPASGKRTPSPLELEEDGENGKEQGRSDGSKRRKKEG